MTCINKPHCGKASQKLSIGECVHLPPAFYQSTLLRCHILWALLWLRPLKHFLKISTISYYLTWLKPYWRIS